MAEIFLKSEIDDIRLSAVIFEEAFAMKQWGDQQWSLSNLKSLHQHSTYEIFFVSEGSLSIVTENETLNVEQAVAIIPPFLNHYTVAKEPDGASMYFSVDKDEKKQGSLYSNFITRTRENISVIPITEDERFYVGHIADALSGALPRDNIGALVSLLFSEIFLRISPKNTDVSQAEGKLVKHINTIDVYLSTHYSESITLSDLSEELYLCEKQISRIIKKEYGCSLSELVNRRRLAVACMLLKYTNMPVGEIAANVGYEYENYFFTVFRQEYGITPKKYREENAKKG